ncbi:unnamed protein product [Amaranthus hypochondriacus]
MYAEQHPPPPNYVMLQNQYGAPPPYYAPQTYPPYQIRRRRSGCNCCLRFICCIYCLLFIFIFFMAITLVFSYTFYKPKIPIYKLEQLNVTAFNMQSIPLHHHPNKSRLNLEKVVKKTDQYPHPKDVGIEGSPVQSNIIVNSEFEVIIKLENPNTKIGFIYGKKSSIVVSFEGSNLCSGMLPSFYQRHQNVTMVHVALIGKTILGHDLYKAITDDQSQGRIPLSVLFNIPITIVLDSVPIRQFEFHVSCYIIVDSLMPHKKPKILSTSYTFGFGV